MEQWLEVTIPSAPEHLDGLAAVLVGAGFDCLQIEDSRDFSDYSPGWDYADDELRAYYADVCQIKLYLPENQDTAEQLALLRSLAPSLTITNRREEDWAENWKQYYLPTPVGERLLIQPAWLPLENPEGRAVFLNNPGMSFGTGLHATTRLCLEALERMDLTGKRVLDLGCGSGILSLCALALGAAEALGTDIDLPATEVAARNAGDNGMSKRFRSVRGNVLEDSRLRASLGRWDVVCSNIVADVIIPLALLVPEMTAESGLWLVSGIITPRLTEVRTAAEAAGWEIADSQNREDWEMLLLCRKQ